MLTLFIISSKDSEFEKTKNSFNLNFDVEFIKVGTIEEINEVSIKNPWFGVFYDNECIEERLQESLLTFFIMCVADALIVFKWGTEKIKYFPRFFRSWITLNEDLVPVNSGLKYERILNGWVLENGKRS